jgi:sugar (pentulose or hexulose) kinase
VTIGRDRREVFIGIDVGTQGVRVAALDETGDLVASARQPFPLAGNMQEQSTDLWWSAVLACLQEVGATLAQVPRFVPVALSVTSTSGTVIPLDAENQPLHDALMYSDKRSTAEVEAISRIAPELGCNASWGLPKIAWFITRFPEVAARIAAWRHAGDVILGRLTGVWDATDVTSALKSGYDPVTGHWPGDLFAKLGLAASWFPRVLPSGVVLSGLLPEIAGRTGLPSAILVTTGMTDGCASQVASGAVRPGQWNTTIGTTMVVKGVTRNRLEDPLGRVYSHRHPDGYWMPGGASNTGAEWIARDYQPEEIAAMEQQARSLIPTRQLAYPLRQPGERFPFLSLDARGFDPDGLDGPALYAARLEGVAYLERLSLELLGELSGEAIETVHSAGGGSQSDLWRRIRSNVLNKPIQRARYGDAGVGAAVVAAAGTRFGALVPAAAALTRIDTTVEPDDLTASYDEGYRHFVSALRDRGYLTGDLDV